MINSLEPSGNYMPQLSEQSVTLYFVFFVCVNNPYVY
jgi:hypothetical protein